MARACGFALTQVREYQTTESVGQELTCAQMWEEFTPELRCLTFALVDFSRRVHAKDSRAAAQNLHHVSSEKHNHESDPDATESESSSLADRAGEPTEDANEPAKHTSEILPAIGPSTKYATSALVNSKPADIYFWGNHEIPPYLNKFAKVVEGEGFLQLTKRPLSDYGRETSHERSSRDARSDQGSSDCYTPGRARIERLLTKQSDGSELDKSASLRETFMTLSNPDKEDERAMSPPLTPKNKKRHGINHFPSHPITGPDNVAESPEYKEKMRQAMQKEEERRANQADRETKQARRLKAKKPNSDESMIPVHAIEQSLAGKPRKTRPNKNRKQQQQRQSSNSEKNSSDKRDGSPLPNTAKADVINATMPAIAPTQNGEHLSPPSKKRKMEATKPTLRATAPSFEGPSSPTATQRRRSSKARPSLARTNNTAQLPSPVEGQAKGVPSRQPSKSSSRLQKLKLSPPRPTSTSPPLAPNSTSIAVAGALTVAAAVETSTIREIKSDIEDNNILPQGACRARNKRKRSVE